MFWHIDSYKAINSNVRKKKIDEGEKNIESPQELFQSAFYGFRESGLFHRDDFNLFLLENTY